MSIDFNNLGPEAEKRVRGHFSNVILDTLLVHLGESELGQIESVMKSEDDKRLYETITRLAAAHPEISDKVVFAIKKEIAALERASKSLNK